ncbi:unnamed protein product [Schistosoma curassoni]|uniref:Phosphodiesterase I n=1 Tax=Schistosoma curassoni TaxID=6186 RepID=A0A183KLR4_9TREM|nr:unnamed protein product [Schistosoma curassoni]
MCILSSLAASLREAQSIKRNQIEQGHKIFQEYVTNLKERKAKGLFNEDKQYDETLKLAEYDVNSDSSSSSSSSSNDNNDNDNEGSIQTNEENVDSHLSVGEEKQALNEPSSSSIDSNQQSFTHDNDNTLIEHEASSLSDTESHEKKASEYDGHHVGDEDSHMDYDESNVAVTDKQLDDESHHEIPETPSPDEKPVIKDSNYKGVHLNQCNDYLSILKTSEFIRKLFQSRAFHLAPQLCRQMPWYGRGWGESALPLEILSHGYVALYSRWWIRRVYLGELENPEFKPMVHIGFRILKEQMAYEPIVGHLLL